MESKRLRRQSLSELRATGKEYSAQIKRFHTHCRGLRARQKFPGDPGTEDDSGLFDLICLPGYREIQLAAG